MRTPIAPPPFRAVKRAKRLDIASDATFAAWLREDGSRTLEEFCDAEWTNQPMMPRGGTAEVTPVFMSNRYGAMAAPRSAAAMETETIRRG